MRNFISPSRRPAALLIMLWLVFGPNAPARRVTYAAVESFAYTCPVEMRLLVITADGNEAVLGAIKSTLDHLGTPYDIHVAGQPGELTPAMLSDAACHGLYQGVILTTGELGYLNSEGHWGSALGAAEWETLRDYQKNFKVRQVAWYTYPNWEYGYNSGYPVDTSLSPVTASFTAAGAEVFPYLNTATPLVIRNAYTYLAAPLPEGATPLLIDADGHALAVVRTTWDGRENLSTTFDGNEHLLHSIKIGYGMINWVTRGMFLGERRVYMSPQVDDLFIHNDQWVASTPCGTPFEMTGYEHRVTASDMQAVLNWQASIQAQPVSADLRLTMAFNGLGATGEYVPDDLTPFMMGAGAKSAFHWVSHTFTHENLDYVSEAQAQFELNQNTAVAQNQLQLPGYHVSELVTPDVSGLTNPGFLNAAYSIGVRYVVSDTSRPGYNNPSPNTGIPNPLLPGMFMIPRHPNNLFFNVGSPADWAAEYNCIYRSYWQRDLSYEEIVGIESDRLLTYLLKGDADPWMFHQTNLDAYDGTHTLLTDLLSATLAKYQASYTLPILSPRMSQIGAMMIQRAEYNASGVSATLHPDGYVTVRVTRPAIIPITGLLTPGADAYGGQPITRILVTPEHSMTLEDFSLYP
jgi:hypothetical protein